MIKPIYRKIRGKLGTLIHVIMPKYFVKSTFLSGLYYLLFSNKFRREQHAVLSGKVKHLRELKSDKSNVYTLIRNTHRIEKGLLMRPRRPVFALDYIEETLDAFENVWDYTKVDTDAQHKWFFDVLTEYFETSGNHDRLLQLKNRFQEASSMHSSSPNTHKDFKSIPYFRSEEEKSKITYEDFYRLTKQRRSVRWFQDKKVPRDLIDKAILAANQSPSACNRQPFRYRIIDDPDFRSEVSSLPAGIRGYEHNIPVLIVVIGNLAAYFDERDRHIIYIDASLANMSLMFALETLGLSSCSINWPDIEVLELKMEKKLGLKKYERPIMCLAVGYPDSEGKVAYSEKRSLAQLRSYN